MQLIFYVVRGALFIHVACVWKWCLVWTFVAWAILYFVNISPKGEMALRVVLTDRIPRSSEGLKLLVEKRDSMPDVHAAFCCGNAVCASLQRAFKRAAGRRRAWHV